MPRIASSTVPVRYLILVYGLLSAIGEDFPDGAEDNNWVGTLRLAVALLLVVLLLMCQAWIRSKLCPRKALKYGDTKAR